MAKIEIDQGSGFCFGVVTAINKAEEELSKNGSLFCMGDIVHNSMEVERLSALGLVTIDRDTFNSLHGVKVLLRAHGEPPETYKKAMENGIELIDATCPVVLRLQKRIKQEYDKQEPTTQIVIFGQRGHAEVLGLVGQTNGTAIVIESLEEAQSLDFRRNIRLYSQTTKSLEEFRRITEFISKSMQDGADFQYYDTICRQVANRIPSIKEFASSHDLILFVSGKKSSNGHILFNECLSVNKNSHFISEKDELQGIDLGGVQSIGICGATSTPKWLMEEVSLEAKRILGD